jgi:hypothetical protein
MRKRLLKWGYRLALVVIILLLAFFLRRAFGDYKGLMEKMLYGEADITSLRGWMNVERVSRLYNADPACICGQYNLSLQECSKRTLFDLDGGGRRRMPPDPRQRADMMAAVYERVTTCMARKPMPQGWMSMDYASRLYSADMGCVCGKMGVSADECPKATVMGLVKRQGPEGDVRGVEDMLWRALGECADTPGAQ